VVPSWEGLDRFGLPRNRCPVSTLDSNVALLVYRTFMAHKYQELSMISLLYYQETLTAGGGGGRGVAAAATRTVIRRNSVSPVPHLRECGDAGTTP